MPPKRAATQKAARARQILKTKQPLVVSDDEEESEEEVPRSGRGRYIQDSAEEGEEDSGSSSCDDDASASGDDADDGGEAAETGGECEEVEESVEVSEDEPAEEDEAVVGTKKRKRVAPVGGGRKGSKAAAGAKDAPTKKTSAGKKAATGKDGSKKRGAAKAASEAATPAKAGRTKKQVSPGGKAVGGRAAVNTDEEADVGQANGGEEANAGGTGEGAEDAGSGHADEPETEVPEEPPQVQTKLTNLHFTVEKKGKPLSTARHQLRPNFSRMYFLMDLRAGDRDPA